MSHFLAHTLVVLEEVWLNDAHFELLLPPTYLILVQPQAVQCYYICVLIIHSSSSQAQASGIRGSSDFTAQLREQLSAHGHLSTRQPQGCDKWLIARSTDLLDKHLSHLLLLGLHLAKMLLSFLLVGLLNTATQHKHRVAVNNKATRGIRYLQLSG